MNDAELRKLAKLIAEELRSQPLPVETRTEHAERMEREEAERQERVARRDAQLARMKLFSRL